MRVVPAFSSTIRPEGWELFKDLGFDPYSSDDWVDDIDIIPEFAGRACYESYLKPNPATASNANYLKHTVSELQHESILEHSTVTLYVSGVSRNMLLELERHRHISFSAISTRYVSPNKMGTVLHPNTPGSFVNDILEHDEAGRILADRIYLNMVANGYDKKQARETARQILGGNLETKFLVTGNLRAWRYIIQLRNHPKADAEIRDFARIVLSVLSRIAPNSVADLVTE